MWGIKLLSIDFDKYSLGGVKIRQFSQFKTGLVKIKEVSWGIKLLSTNFDKYSLGGVKIRQNSKFKSK